jgi:hypothetical protein
LSAQSQVLRFMMDELIDSVARAASLSPEQAAVAVAATLRFFTARLPSTLVGELHARLRGGGAAMPAVTADPKPGR